MVESKLFCFQVDKEEMKKKREDAARITQERAEQERAERATKRREAEKFSIKQQMKACLIVLLIL